MPRDFAILKRIIQKLLPRHRQRWGSANLRRSRAEEYLTATVAYHH